MWVGLGQGYLLPSASFHEILNNLIIYETSSLQTFVGFVK